jgi:aspartate racemase
MLRPLPASAHTLHFEVMEQTTLAPGVALTTFDIILILYERRQGLTGTCIYKTDLFDAVTISRMLDDFQYVLTSLSAQPEQVLATFRFLRSARG